MFLCSPIRVTARFHRRDGSGWGRQIAVTNPLGVEHIMSMPDAALEARSRQEVRLIDIAADTRMHGAFDELHDCADGAAFVKLVSERAASAFGTAGPTFIRFLLENSGEVVGVVHNDMNKFREQSRIRLGNLTEGHISRVVDWFALLYAAGRLATHAGITGWQDEVVLTSILEVLSEWLDARPSGNVSGDQAAIDRTRDYLKTHGSAFTELGGDLAAIDLIGWKDEELFYIPKSTWARIHEGSDAAVAARALERSGFLLRGEGENLARKAPREISWRPRVYTVKASILEVAEPEGTQSELPKAA